MLEKENEIRDILKELEQLDKDAYLAAETRNAAKNELLEKQAQTKRACGMTLAVLRSAGI